MAKDILEIITREAKKQKINIDITPDVYDVPLKDLGIDSFTSLNIIVTIEQELGVRVPDEELDKIKTINDLVQEFKKLLNK